ncbi:MAG: hypothetical protein IPO63_16200 [Bacteroidetes bacterium]|nr:hypothetical protein [Bacteroidota bacterium]
MKTISEKTKLIFAKEIIILFSCCIIIAIIGLFMILSTIYYESRTENLKERINSEYKFIDSLEVNFETPIDTCIYLYNEDTVDVYVLDLISFIKHYPTAKFIRTKSSTKFISANNFSIPIKIDTNVYDIPINNVSEFLSDVTDAEYFPITSKSDSWILFKKHVKDLGEKSLELEDTKNRIYSTTNINDTIYWSAIFLFSVAYPLRFILYLLSWSFTILKKTRKNSI